MNSIRHLIIRLETFETIIKAINNLEILKNIGKDIGNSFVKHLIQIGILNNKFFFENYEFDYNVFESKILYWIEYDQIMGFGTFELVECNKYKEFWKCIKIKSFSHDYSSYTLAFLQGYISGIMETLLTPYFKNLVLVKKVPIIFGIELTNQ